MNNTTQSPTMCRDIFHMASKLPKEASSPALAEPESSGLRLFGRRGAEQPKLQRSSSSSSLRSRFLHRLGFHKGISPEEQRNLHRHAAREDRRSRDSFFFEEEPLKEAKAIDNDDESVSTSPTVAMNSSADLSSFLRSRTYSSLSERSVTSTRSRSVSFDQEIVVYPVPSRPGLESERDDIWMSPSEMDDAVKRNIFEFASEQWDWRQVVDETEMIPVNGELVHPAHLKRDTSSWQKPVAST